MKKIIAMVLAGAMCMALFSGCNSKKEKLVMATEAGFAPYEYMKGTEVVGIDVDIANEIAKELGMELEIQDMDFNSILSAVKSGQADFGVAGLSITPERLEEVDFSIEYATSKQVVVVKKGDTSITKESDLTTKIMGAQQATTAEITYTDDEYDIHPKEIKTYKKYSQAAADLTAGRIDCIVMDELPAQLLVEKTEGLEIANAELFTDSYGMAVKKGNTELKEKIDKVLQKLIDDGKIQEFTEKHAKEAL